jgi:uncharacterized membrane protein YfcA
VPDPLLFWSLALTAAFLTGASKGGLPLVSSLSVPMMALFMPTLEAAALLLPVYIVSDIYGLWLYRRTFSVRNLAILIPASLLGILAGWLLAGQTDDMVVRFVTGLVGLFFVALRLVGRLRGQVSAKRAGIPQGLFWGSIAGFTSFVAHAGGPPFQVYTLPQKLPKMTFAGTATILFAVINLAKLPPYLALDLLHWGDMRVVAWLAPVALLGAFLGYRLALILPERLFFAFVELALFVISIKLIWDSLPHLLG